MFKYQIQTSSVSCLSAKFMNNIIAFKKDLVVDNFCITHLRAYISSYLFFSDINNNILMSTLEDDESFKDTQVIYNYYTNRKIIKKIYCTPRSLFLLSECGTLYRIMYYDIFTDGSMTIIADNVCNFFGSHDIIMIHDDNTYTKFDGTHKIILSFDHNINIKEIYSYLYRYIRGYLILSASGDLIHNGKLLLSNIISLRVCDNKLFCLNNNNELFFCERNYFIKKYLCQYNIKSIHLHNSLETTCYILMDDGVYCFEYNVMINIDPIQFNPRKISCDTDFLFDDQINPKINTKSAKK